MILFGTGAIVQATEQKARKNSPPPLSAAFPDSSPEIPPSSAKDNGRKRHAEQFFRAVGRVKRRKRHVPGNKVKIGLLSEGNHCTLLARKVRTVRTTHF